MEKPFHQHCLIKAFVKKPPTGVRKLNKWLKELVKAIDMKVLVPPKSVYLDVAGNRGITGTVVIETSHCAIHVWDEVSPALVQFDVYSCKEFDVGVLIKKIEEFKPSFLEYMLVDRNQSLLVTKYDAKAYK
jgi:S-adenosylmethionine/arginine decarboxylase-like enzyme